jgi:hypothetical protein
MPDRDFPSVSRIHHAHGNNRYDALDRFQNGLRDVMDFSEAMADPQVVTDPAQLRYICFA